MQTGIAGMERFFKSFDSSHIWSSDIVLNKRPIFEQYFIRMESKSKNLRKEFE